MKQPSPEQGEALQRLAARPEGGVVLEYLRDAMTDIHSRLLQTADPVQLRVLQGEGRAVAMLLGFWKP